MYEHRLKVFLTLAVLAVGVIVARLGHLQWVGGDEYRRRAERMLTDVEFLPTVRGQVLDRAGRVLAFDQACFEFCLDYPMLCDPPPTAWVRRQVTRIRQERGLASEQARQILQERIDNTWVLAERITGVPRNDMARAAENAVRRIEAIRRVVGMPIRLQQQPQPIVGGLDEDQAAALRTHLPEMVGASVQPSYQRRYPNGQTACHLVGVLGEVTGEEMGRSAGPDDTLESRLTGYFQGDRVGRNGAEALCEPMLRGRRGYRRVRTTGEVVEEVPARFGQDVRLTVDIELQQRLGALLGRNGVIIVLEVPTGQVLAMVSLPTYDPNEYRARFVQLSGETVDRPLLNRALSGRYPPGSSVKPIVALAGLSENVITPDTTFLCRGYLHQPDAFRCFHRIAHGEIALLQAIEQSCNVFFYNVGERLGVRRLDDWFTRFGYADLPGTLLAAECPGLLPDPRKTRYAGDARMLAIGQGLAVTPMHVVNAVAAIARGGTWMSPVVVAELADRQQRRDLDIPPQHLTLVREGMRRVVNSPRGTAKSARHDQVEVCGKTGTAETPPLFDDANHNGLVDEGETVYRSGDTAWFTGYAPADDPQIALVVVVEYSDQAGGALCGPLARQVVEICREMGYLP